MGDYEPVLDDILQPFENSLIEEGDAGFAAWEAGECETITLSEFAQRLADSLVRTVNGVVELRENEEGGRQHQQEVETEDPFDDEHVEIRMDVINRRKTEQGW